MTDPHAAPEPDDPRSWLSDLTDGRLHGDDLAEACRAWADDAEVRRTWHTYHLIGDVLRSDDLARAAPRDAAFLDTLRQRLADEPVVLAPAAASSPRPARPPRRQVWLLPVAAAAGFVAVAGVLVVLQQAAPGGGFQAAQMAASPPPAVGLRTVSAGAATTAPAALVTRGQMLRDARLDEYLRAHREVLMGSPAALPGGGVRSVDFDATVAR